MAHSPLPARALEYHAELTQVPEEAARVSALLNKNLLGALRFDVSDIAALAADIERRLNLAEEAHERALGLVSLTNQR